MRIRSIRYGKLLLLLMTFLLVMFLFILTQLNIRPHKIGIVEGSFLHRHLDKLPVGIGGKFHQWLQKDVFQFKWEEIHCRKSEINETVVLFKKWAPKLAKQLNIKSGHSIFDSNIVCNEWFLALNSTFKNLVFGGVDESEDVLKYSKSLFKKYEKNFVKVDKLQDLSRIRTQYDHVLNYGGVTILKDETVKCNIVKSLFSIVRPGGSMYIGHNVESNYCKDSFQDTVLPPCFWSDKCLKERSDIAEMYYIKEVDLFGKDKTLYNCYTGVFIHKKVFVMRQVEVKEPSARFEPHKEMFYCSDAQSYKPNRFVDNALSILKGTGLSQHRNLASAIRKYTEIQQKKKS